ncbi:S41 family peptidase [Verrucomicrobiota bacterium sgz303538]
MKTPMHRALPAVLLVALASQGRAQAPATTPAPAPAENKAPAEIVPAKPPTTPAPGQKTTEVPDRKESLSPGTKEPAPDPAVERKAGVDALSDAELDQALSAMKQRYVTPGAFSETELKRATIQGLLDRLGAGADLHTGGKGDSAEPSPFRTETLDKRIGYIRLGTPNQANIGELDKALKQFAEQKLAAVVLDLRATPSGSDLEGAAEVIRRFSPKGKVLFTLRRRDAKEQIFTSKDEPLYRGLLVVLTDRDTAGAGEIIAAVLRAQAGAMVIGEKTAGKAAEFSEVPLGGGNTLRVAVAEVTLPEGQSLFSAGVKPDLSVDVAPETTAAVLKQGLESGVAPLIVETDRPRMNEAALVAGVNPELDSLLAAQRNRGEKPKTPLRDAVLQRAIDFVTTVTIYEKGTKGKK